MELEMFMSDSVNDTLQDLKNTVSSIVRAGARATDGVAEVDMEDIKELEVVTKVLESYLLLSK